MDQQEEKLVRPLQAPHRMTRHHGGERSPEETVRIDPAADPLERAAVEVDDGQPPFGRQEDRVREAGVPPQRRFSEARRPQRLDGVTNGRPFQEEIQIAGRAMIGSRPDLEGEKPALENDRMMSARSQDPENLAYLTLRERVRGRLAPSLLAERLRRLRRES